MCPGEFGKLNIKVEMQEGCYIGSGHFISGKLVCIVSNYVV